MIGLFAFRGEKLGTRPPPVQGAKGASGPILAFIAVLTLIFPSQSAPIAVTAARSAIIPTLSSCVAGGTGLRVGDTKVIHGASSTGFVPEPAWSITRGIVRV